MKNLFSIGVFMVVVLFLAYPISMQAQTVTKECNGKTYVFDYENRKVYRQDLGGYSLQVSTADKFLAKPKTPIRDVYRKVFSTKRLEELKLEKMVTRFTCDSKGKVENVEFLFFKKPFLSVDEIEKLERAFGDYTFDIQTFGEKATHYTFALACFFKNI